MNHSESSEDKKQTSAEQHDGEAHGTGIAVSPEETNTADQAQTDAVQQPESESSSLGKRNWLVIIGAIALLIGGGFLGWRWWQTSNAQNQSPPGQMQARAIPVEISTVESSTIRENTEFVAQLESRQSVTLLPQIQGRVSKIYVTPGTQVKAGAPIIQIDPDEQQAEVSGFQAAAAAARAQVANAEATLRSLEAERLSNVSQSKLSQNQYERYSRLAAQGAVSQETADQYSDQLRTARSSLAAVNQRIEAQRATLEQAQEAVQQAQADIKQAKVQLQYYTINAPFVGTVGAIPVKVGDFVNTSTQLTTVTQNQPLEVNISIPRERAYQVEVGTPVELLNEQGQMISTSRVFFISPQVTDDTQSVLIKALFKNSPTQLRADSFVRARVIWNQQPGVLVPATAVTRIGKQAFIYVVEQPKSEPESAKQGQAKLIARQKPVELGSIQGNSYQILEGLKPGERIVTSGLIKLSDGAAVVPSPPPAEKAGGAREVGEAEGD